MKFNLNKFLFAISYALDLAESEIQTVSSFHSKRVAFLSIKIAQTLNLSKEEIFDLYSYALLHDNGLIEAFQLTRENNKDKINENLVDHCTIGEENIRNFPFLTDQKDVILYHHEHYDGTGFFKKRGEDIPLFSQIIFMADVIDSNFELKKISYETKVEIEEFLDQQRNRLFSDKLVDTFLTLSDTFSFWGELEYFYTTAIPQNLLQDYEVQISIDEFFNITDILSNLIDSKSKFTAKHSKELAQKTHQFIKEFDFDEITQKKLLISANLHDIGKLATPTNILEKPGALSDKELFEIKKHAYFTYSILSSLNFCDDIVSWASYHHEKPDGSGYPFGLKNEELGIEARIIACLDFYQALVEERPYRKAMEHDDATSLMKTVLNDFEMDLKIISKIDKVFK